MCQSLVTLPSPSWATWASAPHVRWLPYVDTLLTLLGLNQSVSDCPHSPSPPYESFVFSFGLHPTAWCLSTRTPSLPNLNSSSPALGTLPYSCPPRLAWLPIPHSKSPLHLDCPPHPAQVLTSLQAALLTRHRLRYQTTTQCEQTTLLFQLDPDIPLWACWPIEMPTWLYLWLIHLQFLWWILISCYIWG